MISCMQSRCNWVCKGVDVVITLSLIYLGGNATTFTIFLFRWYIWQTPIMWHITPEDVFSLSEASLHISSHSQGSRVALQFTFCHDAVLHHGILVSTMKSFSILSQISKTKFLYMKFVKAGARLPKTSKENNWELLHSVLPRVILSDFESTLVNPPAITISQYKPDIFLNTTTIKIVIILELTYSYEQSMESWNTIKFENMINFVQN